ncbi:COPII coat Sec23p-Sfb3p heterodimer component [Haplosporangium sp. Z 27]|nr:COPII coat Sec23p-Sfb3p heterodimer component [Haplosporangium sp. Z 27]
MSGYPQQQQQQQRPPPPGQGQFAPASNGYSQQQPPSPFQHQQNANFGPYGNAPRPGAPIPGSPGVRPNNMSPGFRPMQPGPGSPARPPINGLPNQQQQQQYGVRPNPGPPSGARPPMGPRPPIASNQQIRTASPLPGQSPRIQSHSPSPRPAYMNQIPTPTGTPGPAAQNIQSSPIHPPQPPFQRAGTPLGQNAPPQPSFQRAGTPLGHNAPPQQVPHQQQQQQQPTPPMASPDQGGANVGGLYNQMSNMSIGTNGPADQQAPGFSSMPPQGSSIQSEAKPKPGARAKRVFVTDPSASATTPTYQGQLGGVQPVPQAGINSFDAQNNMQSQQPYGTQNFGQPMNQGYTQEQQQQHQNMPPQYQQSSMPPQYQQSPMPQQPVGQQQQFRPQSQPQVQPGSKSRIDPDQIPSPVAVQEADQVAWNDKPFITSSRTHVSPLASSDFMAIDEGNCNPRFFRMTTYNIPNTEDLLSTSQLPLGLIIQPLAKLRADEAPIETVDFGDAGPARCNRCKAYINPYMIFTNGGQRFVCNMCLFENEVDPNYFCNLDMSGRRLDLDQRPELRNGTIEFAVPKEYWNKTPAPAAYVFAIDVSWNAIQSGMLAQCITGIKSAVWDANGVSRLAPGAQIGILTFDKTVHFYNLSSSLEQAQMMVVPDVNDVFVPLSDGFLVNPESSKSVVETLLDSLPQLFAENKITEPVIGAVVQAVHTALENRGGKLIVFQTSLPTYGPGALKHRDDSKLYGTDKERTLYAPQDEFYRKLGESCVDAGLSVDLFLFPNAYVDVATLGCLPSITGGETFMYPGFNVERDGTKLIGNIVKLVGRPFGYNALMRVRCSAGLRISEHLGNFHMKNSTDLELAGVDSEKAFGVLVRHDGKLDDRKEASFQVALLYTTADGLRRVRVHNFSTPVTTLMGNVFRWADMDTTINFLAKGAIAQGLTKPLNDVRDALTERCVKILSAYRKNCASSTAPGQLILPESYKLFPCYALTLLKSKALRAGRDINSDMRVYQMRALNSMTVSESIVFLYPRMFPIHELSEKHGVMEQSGRVFLPSSVRVSYARLYPEGAYLLENGQNIYIWLGQNVSTEFLSDVFGVSSLDEINPNLHHLPEFSTPINTKLRTIVSYLQTQRSRYLNLIIVRQGREQSELDFSNQLLEDKNNESMSYVDYLCAIHRMIQNDASARSDKAGLWTPRLT